MSSPNVPSPPPLQQPRPLSSLALSSAFLAASLVVSLTCDPLTPKFPPHPGAQKPRDVLGGAHYSFVRPQQWEGPLALAAVSEAGAESLALRLPITSTEKDEWAEILSGHKLLKGSRPFAQNYAGYQLGVWIKQYVVLLKCPILESQNISPRLGDGRVVTLGDIQTGSSKATTCRWEVQVKGIGKTPYARTYDGLLTLAGAVREYLGCEVLRRLSIPTALPIALVVPASIAHPSTPSVPPCIFSRAAPSFLRIGSYEVHTRDGVALKKLVDWTLENVEQFRACNDDTKGWSQGINRYGRFLREVVRCNAKMVAAWQAAAFVHGTLNSDNISVLGLTLDVTGYTFLDAYDPDFTPNIAEHRFSEQPRTVKGILRRFGELLAQFIDPSGDVFEGDRRAAAIMDEFDATFKEHFTHLMRGKLGLTTRAVSTDFSDIIQPLLDILASCRADYHRFFRLISFSRLYIPTLRRSSRPNPPDLLSFLLRCLDRRTQELRPPRRGDAIPSAEEASGAWKAWHARYQFRLHAEATPGTNMIETELARKLKMFAINPRVVPRGYILDQVISECEKAAQEFHERAKKEERERAERDGQAATSTEASMLILDDEAGSSDSSGFIMDDLSSPDADAAPLYDGAVSRLASISHHLQAASKDNSPEKEKSSDSALARALRRATTVLVHDMFGEISESPLDRGVGAPEPNELGVLRGSGLVRVVSTPSEDGDESQMHILETGFADLKECCEVAIRWANDDVPKGKLNLICKCDT
ncbi:UPF0061-domain-containing protein [Gonapodya prolifera JEL478]|uniref:Selenoprotein O n=1 Tax=Gonapodya prolifera (strain JEL478) TaxID=1344416 RepID=A0A139AZA0_GONPJ|nr:UPF0061-domain-containing protein [Gonapodya prolifera JEL478]|eukprot:KXS22078.1 UPF0061-domain-containing protein [Gonapodya prolifera JEL478]